MPTEALIHYHIITNGSAKAPISVTLEIPKDLALFCRTFVILHTERHQSSFQSKYVLA